MLRSSSRRCRRSRRNARTLTEPLPTALKLHPGGVPLARTLPRMLIKGRYPSVRATAKIAEWSRASPTPARRSLSWNRSAPSSSRPTRSAGTPKISPGKPARRRTLPVVEWLPPSARSDKLEQMPPDVAGPQAPSAANETSVSARMRRATADIFHTARQPRLRRLSAAQPAPCGRHNPNTERLTPFSWRSMHS